jgi:hypothetical protein
MSVVRVGGIRCEDTHPFAALKSGLFRGDAPENGDWLRSEAQVPVPLFMLDRAIAEIPTLSSAFGGLKSGLSRGDAPENGDWLRSEAQVPVPFFMLDRAIAKRPTLSPAFGGLKSGRFRAR